MRMPGRAMHSGVLTYRDGRPPCGSRGNVVRSMNLGSITCGNCRDQLLTAMATGFLNIDFGRWFKEWHSYSYESSSEARDRYSHGSLNKGIWKSNESEGVLSKRSALAYDITSIREADGKFSPHIRAQCAKCDSRLLIKMASAQQNPQEIGKWIVRKGWEFDPYKPASPRCPDCLKKAKDKATGESPNKEPPSMTTSNVAALTLPARPLSAEEKLKVRNLLDSHFDEAKGIYLDGYSDQRVGTEAAVPWANVRAIREAAYGPLQSVPELDGLIADNRALAEKASEIAKHAAALQTQNNDLAKRIADMAKKMGLAA